MRGNGSIGVIEFPDGYTDEADTSVYVLFGGDVAVLTSDPALGAPFRGEAGGNAYTEIGGTLAATPGQEYRFEFTVLPAEEGVTVIDAAGFLRGAARLVLDVAPAAGLSAQGNQQSAAAPDPPERAGPRDGGPPGGPSLDDAIRAALAAPRAGAPVPAPAGADSGIPAGSLAGRGGPGPSGHPRAALPGPEPAPGGPGSRSGAADAGAGDLVLYGQIRMELPYSNLTGPAHGLYMCATDYNIVDASETLLNYTDGTAACTFANEHGWYVLGPLDGTDPDGDGTGSDLSIYVLSAGDGMYVMDNTTLPYYEASSYYLRDREAGNARLDMDVEDDAMNGAARIVDAISDTKAYFEEELGIEIPAVDVFWHYGKPVAKAWPKLADDGDTAFYTQRGIFLDGLKSNASYDWSESRYTIQHEYGHHVQTHLGGPSEGCTHHFKQKISPECAFGEGLAYFIPHMVDGAAKLRDYEDVFVNIEQEVAYYGTYIDILFNYDNSTDKQTEIQVAGALWDVYDEHVDETHDRKRSRAGGQTVPESGILDDLHMGADEIIQIVQDGPQNAEQFYVRWEKQADLGSMANIMDLHRMPFNATGDLPVFDAIPAVTVSHTGEAAVPVSATHPGGASVSLDVRQGFDDKHDDPYGGATIDDNGDGTGTLILRPARADVGENFVVVRANSSGNVELARVDVTVTEPPKWAPVQLNSTFDRDDADWLSTRWSDVDGWWIDQEGGSSAPHLRFKANGESDAFMRRSIDMTAYASAELRLLRSAPLLEAGSYLDIYAVTVEEWWLFENWWLIGRWGADNVTVGFEEESVVLPPDLLVDNFRIAFVAKGLPANSSDPFSVRIDDVAITGTLAGPAIEAPDDVKAEAASPGSTTAVVLGAPTTHPASGLDITREPQGPFSPGTTRVTWTATDPETGKSDTDTQWVTVFDATPPSVAPPADYTVYAGGAEVSLSVNDYCAASATDAVSDVVVLHNATAGPPAGENSTWIANPDPSGGPAAAGFPVGSTSTVTWLALDYSGNQGTATQNVAVVQSGTPHVPVSAVRAWADPDSPREPGSAMTMHVEFTHPVALTAAMSGEAPGSLLPSLEMDGGGSATYASGNGTDRLTFSYTVQPGETAPDYAGTDALGGPCTIRSMADNRGADLELPDPGPTDPGPTDPGPTDPGPTDPGPTDPGPTDPGPSGGQAPLLESAALDLTAGENGRLTITFGEAAAAAPDVRSFAGEIVIRGGGGEVALSSGDIPSVASGRAGDAAFALDISGAKRVELNGPDLGSATIELPAAFVSDASGNGYAPGGQPPVPLAYVPDPSPPRLTAASFNLAPAGGAAGRLVITFDEAATAPGAQSFPGMIEIRGRSGGGDAAVTLSADDVLSVESGSTGDRTFVLLVSDRARAALDAAAFSDPESTTLLLPAGFVTNGRAAHAPERAPLDVARDPNRPAFLLAFVLNGSSVAAVYSEPVLAVPSHYANITVDGAAAAGNGGGASDAAAFGNNVIVSWNANASTTAAAGSAVGFDLSANVTDAFGNPLENPGAKYTAGPGGTGQAGKQPVRVGVFARGAGDPSMGAARLGAAAFNAVSVERGYAFYVDVSEHDLPAGALGAAALRGAHGGGSGPSLYVGPASDTALAGMADYASENGITIISHSSAARPLAMGGDPIFRMEPGVAHLARVLAAEVARGGYGAIVPVVQTDLHGPGYGLLEQLESDLEPLGIHVGEPVAFAGGGGAAAAPVGAAVAAAAGSGTARSVAVVYMGSDAELAAMAGSVPADGPIRERSAWFAVGGAGAGAGSGVAASPAVLADAAAMQLARDVQLSAVQFAVERNSITDYIDRIAAPRGPATSATPAYAAYEAVRALGGALVLAGGDPSLAGGNVAGAAALVGGPLGRTGMDGSGDLRLPVTYGAWSVSDTSAEWERAPALLRGLDSCGIDLEKPALALPELSAGSTSRPARQTVTNVGTTPMPAVSVSATDWAQFRDGVPVQGQLPFSLTEMAVGLDGASPRRADSTPLAAGTEIPGGTPPGSSLDVDFRINLDGLDALDADFISQTVTFVVNCS